MNISIRRANQEDAAIIAPLIYEAIGDIAFRLTGEENLDRMINKLETLIKHTNNRHSYQFTYVAHKDDLILGIVVLYDGATGFELDRSLEAFIKEHYAQDVKIDVEAHPDEFYIDTICVASNARGHGIGTLLLKFAEEEGKRQGYSHLSLNVEEEKLRARELYEREGFVVTEPWSIIDEPFHHMVKQI